MDKDGVGGRILQLRNTGTQELKSSTYSAATKSGQVEVELRCVVRSYRSWEQTVARRTSQATSANTH